MTERQDPIQIDRRSLAAVPPVAEDAAPTIDRAEVWPYADLTRLWVMLQICSITAAPDLILSVFDPDGALATTLCVVACCDPYQSFTLHLRRPPRAGERYRLTIELSTDQTVLDRRTLDFDLVFRDPATTASPTTDELPRLPVDPQQFQM